MVKPDCNHCVLDIKADGTFKSAKELSIMGHRMQIHDVTGTFAGDHAGVDITDKMHIGLNILDTDYDHYAVFYQCFENISKVQDDKTLKPAHVQIAAIASRDANWKDEDYLKIQNQVLTKLTDLTDKDFTRFVSGDAGKCVYDLKMTDL